VEDEAVKQILIFLLALPAAFAQTATGSISGKVQDAKTAKPVSAAWVIANRAGAPPLVKNAKSGGYGSFQIQGLTAGTYSLCVQVEGVAVLRHFPPERLHAAHIERQHGPEPVGLRWIWRWPRKLDKPWRLDLQL
jgi:hypothetical protein